MCTQYAHVCAASDAPLVVNRTIEQKQRLVAGAPFERPMYLVEGSACEQDLMPAATLEQAIVSTQVRDGLAVLRTTSVHDSIACLCRLHRQLVHVMRGPSPARARWMRYDDYRARCARPQHRALRELFGHQLLQIPGCGPAKATALLHAYGTPSSLLSALQPCANRAAPLAPPAALVAAVGAALSRRVVALFGPDWSRV